jgi:hypothetical protein
MKQKPKFINKIIIGPQLYVINHFSLVGNPKGKRLLERPRRRWKDSNNMDLRDIGYGDMDWIHPAQDTEQ